MYHATRHHVRRLLRKRPSRHMHRAFQIVGLAGLAACGAFVAWALIVTVPSVDGFQSRRVAESTKIYDRTGNVLLHDVHGSMRRTAVSLNDIAPYIRNATIAIEDAEFYQHNGFRPRAFLRAILVNLHLREGFRGQGGSTITQQVVKNTLLTQDKTIIRKLKEIVLALKLERVTTKDRILEIYLNETSYGGTIYGVEEASQYFFGKKAKDVSLAEAAYLAALPQAPTRYSPYGNNRDELEDRQELVLIRMRDFGFISKEEFDRAQAEEVIFKDTQEAGIKAPHFVFYVREYLESKYGADVVATQGLRVVTTLDYQLQKKAEEIVGAAALENEKNFNAENAGLVAIDPKTGHILTMVGSRGYFDDGIDGKVNVTLAKRQPGSSFKPFVYAAAFEKGYTPDTILFDLATQFTGYCAPNDFETHDNCYSPVNYDGKFQGPMTLRSALAQSVNVVAVKTLYLVGLESALDLARRLGIDTLGDAGRYGLTLVLGGGEVTLLEMTSAYATLAHEGVRRPETAILEVRDARGKVLEKYEDVSERVLDENVAREVSDVLSDNVARTPAFGSNSALYFPGAAVAAKTGTTNDYRDAWIVGYTPSLSVGAWAGNNNNTPMQKRVAGFIVAPMWHEFFEHALTSYPPEDFTPPAPYPENLPPALRGSWNTNPAQGVHEILYWVDKRNPRSGIPPANPSADPQFALWEYPVSLWVQGMTASSSATSTPGGGGAQDFAIAWPVGGSTIAGNTPVRASVEFLSTLGVARVSYYLNEVSLGTSVTPPFDLEFTTNVKGTALLRAVAETLQGPRESSALITVQ